MTLLTAAEYPSVRAAIDVSLDSDLLPDTIIALDIYAGSAERDVLAIDPGAASLTGSDGAHATAAAVYFCAGRLCVALPQIVREGYADHSYQRREVDPERRAAELRGLAAAELEAYLDLNGTTGDRPTMFATACGRRGRW